MANSKDVVVTGVSTGIGWGTTKVLLSKGFRVFGSVRKQADADRLQREFGGGFVPSDDGHYGCRRSTSSCPESRLHHRRQESCWPGEQCRNCGEWAAALSATQRV